MQTKNGTVTAVAFRPGRGELVRIELDNGMEAYLILADAALTVDGAPMSREDVLRWMADSEWWVEATLHRDPNHYGAVVKAEFTYQYTKPTM